MLDELEGTRVFPTAQGALSDRQREQFRVVLLEHATFLLRHRERLFLWQHYAAVVVFVVVHVLVLTGLVLSILQFTWTFRPPRGKLARRSRRAPQQGDIGSGEPSIPEEVQVTEVEISPASVKIRSAFVGLALLVVSMAFFYLYLQEVFPLKPFEERLPAFTEPQKP